MKKTNNKRTKVQSALHYTYLSTQFMVFLGIGVFGGLKLDNLWHTKPLMIVILPTIALIGSLVILYRQLIQ